MTPLDPAVSAAVFSEPVQAVAEPGKTPSATTVQAVQAAQPAGPALPARRPLARRAVCDCGSRLETSAERHYRTCWWCLRLEA